MEMILILLSCMIFNIGEPVPKEKKMDSKSTLETSLDILQNRVSHLLKCTSYKLFKRKESHWLSQCEPNYSFLELFIRGIPYE